MRSTIDTSIQQSTYSPLHQEVQSILEQLGNPGTLEQDWKAYQQRLLDLDPLQLEQLMPQLRSDMLDSLFANAARSKSVAAFAEAYLYQIKHSIVQDQPITLSPQHSAQVLELETLYHRFPEIIHPSCILYTILKLQGRNVSDRLADLSQEYTLFRNPDVRTSIEQPTSEELEYLEMIAAGMTAQEIAKIIYRRHTELLEVSN